MDREGQDEGHRQSDSIPVRRQRRTRCQLGRRSSRTPVWSSNDSGQKRDPVILDCGSDRYPNGPRPAKPGLVERSEIGRGPR